MREELKRKVWRECEGEGRGAGGSKASEPERGRVKVWRQTLSKINTTAVSAGRHFISRCYTKYSIFRFHPKYVPP